MKRYKSSLITLVLLAIAVSIHLYSADEVRVENQYSTVFYPALAHFMRQLFGWLPFSFGDLLYGLAILWLILKGLKAIKYLLKRQVNTQRFTKGAIKIVNILLLLYIFFNVLWGINYNRIGVAEQLGLKMENYDLADLKQLNHLLVEKVNASKRQLIMEKAQYPNETELFEKVEQAYTKAETIYPFLHYQSQSLKPSLWSWAGNYIGFTGYYNPFTAEAQVNTMVPKFLLPFTSCHEVAHQLGYAKEMEANFVGYLAGTASEDVLIQYSVYLDLFMYSNRNLLKMDSSIAKSYREQLISPVKVDLKEWNRYYLKYRNPIEPFFRWIYGVYLEQNQQPNGVLSYDEVTGFMIAYYKKFGKI